MPQPGCSWRSTRPCRCARSSPSGRAAWRRARAWPASSRGALRLLDAQSLHLTLCFLGSRPVGEIEALAAALGACAEHACELSVGAPLWLPPRRPRALAVEIHDRSGELARVQERVSGALARASGWEPQRRRFRPHITLARIRRGAAGAARGPARAGAGASSSSLPATPRLSFTPEAIVLYRSWLAPEGASYEALASSGLRGGRTLSARCGCQLGVFAGDARAVARGCFAGSVRSSWSPARRRRPGRLFFAFRFARARSPSVRRADEALAVAGAVGVAPSSHSGSEPSSQEKDPSRPAPVRCRLRSTRAGPGRPGARLGSLLGRVCLARRLVAWCALPLCEARARAGVGLGVGGGVEQVGRASGRASGGPRTPPRARPATGRASGPRVRRRAGGLMGKGGVEREGGWGPVAYRRRRRGASVGAALDEGRRLRAAASDRPAGMGANNCSVRSAV